MSTYNEEKVVRALEKAYHLREQTGVLTAAVTTKFKSDATSTGAQKIVDKLLLSADVDHADAVTAFAELLS